MPTGVYPRRPPLERLMSRVEQDGLLGHWLWRGTVSVHGYGVFALAGRRINAHRAAYILLVGPVDPSLDIDHLCRVRLCVNPAHLEPVTRAVNVQRAMPFRKNTRTDVCANGHPRTPENTYDRPDRNGRNCKPCSLEATRRWRRKVA